MDRMLIMEQLTTAIGKQKEVMELLNSITIENDAPLLHIKPLMIVLQTSGVYLKDNLINMRELIVKAPKAGT